MSILFWSLILSLSGQGPFWDARLVSSTINTLFWKNKLEILFFYYFLLIFIFSWKSFCLTNSNSVCAIEKRLKIKLSCLQWDKGDWRNRCFWSLQTKSCIIAVTKPHRKDSPKYLKKFILYSLASKYILSTWKCWWK